MGSMVMNMAANMLGLGNAATPFGLKAMAELNRLNPYPGVATDAMVLSGDLVFAGSIGRSDFPNSSPGDMRASLRRFLAFADELPVLPGHGSTTTVGQERATNPFLRDLED